MNITLICQIVEIKIPKEKTNFNVFRINEAIHKFYTSCKIIVKSFTVFSSEDPMRLIFRLAPSEEPTQSFDAPFSSYIE